MGWILCLCDRSLPIARLHQVTFVLTVGLSDLFQGLVRKCPQLGLDGEVDPKAGELHKDGRCVVLREQPLQLILAAGWLQLTGSRV